MDSHESVLLFLIYIILSASKFFYEKLKKYTTSVHSINISALRLLKGREFNRIRMNNFTLA